MSESQYIASGSTWAGADLPQRDLRLWLALRALAAVGCQPKEVGMTPAEFHALSNIRTVSPERLAAVPDARRLLVARTLNWRARKARRPLLADLARQLTEGESTDA